MSNLSWGLYYSVLLRVILYLKCQIFTVQCSNLTLQCLREDEHSLDDTRGEDKVKYYVAGGLVENKWLNLCVTSGPRYLQTLFELYHAETFHLRATMFFCRNQISIKDTEILVVIHSGVIPNVIFDWLELVRKNSALRLNFFWKCNQRQLKKFYLKIKFLHFKK